MKDIHIVYVVSAINADGGSKVKCVCKSKDEANRRSELLKADERVFYATWYAVPFYGEPQEVRFMAVLKTETKRHAFFVYGGGFNVLPKSEADVEQYMSNSCYLRSDYEIVAITKEEAKEFINTQRKA